MIYFDTEHEAYQQRETIERWGKTYLTECTDEEYQELLERKKIWVNDEIVDNPNYEEEQAQKERERIAKLSLTKREVFLALYKDKGITPEQLKAQILDAEALIEFEYATDYYRGNPLIDQIGIMLGYTSKDLDYLFEHKELPNKEIDETSEDEQEEGLN